MAAIKLPQQTDFHSEVCIVPIDTDDNTVRLNSRNTSAAPTLDSCVTCVGCITSAEEVFVRESSEEVLRQMVDNNISLHFVLSQPAAAVFDVQALRAGFPGFVFDVEDLEKVARAHANFSVCEHRIITHCPAVRLYILKRRPELYRYVFDQASQLESSASEKGQIVYISTCHDRKIEAMKRGVKCFTALEFAGALRIQPQAQQNEPDFTRFELQDILAERFGPCTASRGANSDQDVYEYAELTFVHSKGYRNLENLVRRARRIPEEKKVYLVEACARGCFGGAQMPLGRDLALPANKLLSHTPQCEVGPSCFQPGELHDAKGIKVSDLQW